MSGDGSYIVMRLQGRNSQTSLYFKKRRGISGVSAFFGLNQIRKVNPKISSCVAWELGPYFFYVLKTFNLTILEDDDY